MKILVLYEFRAKWHVVECLELEGIHKGNGKVKPLLHIFPHPL